mmetsp:Transcript_11713/g.30031  ORF Transcript_11713/g.30031 Transcript_11713/m.30031 type:complete len:222 (+) Transcript_11713:943-1608(+)
MLRIVSPNGQARPASRLLLPPSPQQQAVSLLRAAVASQARCRWCCPCSRPLTPCRIPSSPCRTRALSNRSTAAASTALQPRRRTRWTTWRISSRRSSTSVTTDLAVRRGRSGSGAHQCPLSRSLFRFFRWTVWGWTAERVWTKTVTERDSPAMTPSPGSAQCRRTGWVNRRPSISAQMMAAHRLGASKVPSRHHPLPNLHRLSRHASRLRTAARVVRSRLV